MSFNLFKVAEFKNMKGPYHKAEHEVEQSSCVYLDVQYYDGSKANPDPWVQFTLNEQYWLRGSDHRQQKTITFYLTEAERIELIEKLGGKIGG